MNRNIANSAHIETMLISNSYTPTMIMKSLEISEPLSLISHVFGGTWVGVPRRIITTRKNLRGRTSHSTLASLETESEELWSRHRSCSDMSLTLFADMNLAFRRVVIRTGPLFYAKETHKHITSTTVYMTNIYFTKAGYNLPALQYIV